MPDIFDKAQAADEVNTHDALERQRLIALNTPRMTPRGECLNPHCAEPFASNDNVRLYCNADCAEEHRRLRRA